MLLSMTCVPDLSAPGKGPWGFRFQDCCSRLQPCATCHSEIPETSRALAEATQPGLILPWRWRGGWKLSLRYKRDLKLENEGVQITLKGRIEQCFPVFGNVHSGDTVILLCS